MALALLHADTLNRFYHIATLTVQFPNNDMLHQAE